MKKYIYLLAILGLLPSLAYGSQGKAQQIERLQKELDTQQGLLSVFAPGSGMYQTVSDRIQDIKNTLAKLTGAPAPKLTRLQLLTRELQQLEQQRGNVGSAMRKQVDAKISSLRSQIKSLESK